MDQCAVAGPNALMKHLGVLPAHKSRRRHREQHGNHDEDKKFSLECRVSPSLVTSSTHDSASAAERIVFLTSARSPGDPPGRSAPNRRLANRIAFSHVLSSENHVQVYLGHPRLDAGVIEHIRRSVTKAPKRARQPEAAMRAGARLYLE